MVFFQESISPMTVTLNSENPVSNINLYVHTLDVDSVNSIVALSHAKLGSVRSSIPVKQ